MTLQNQNRAKTLGATRRSFIFYLQGDQASLSPLVGYSFLKKKQKFLNLYFSNFNFLTAQSNRGGQVGLRNPTSLAVSYSNSSFPFKSETSNSLGENLRPDLTYKTKEKNQNLKNLVSKPLPSLFKFSSTSWQSSSPGIELKTSNSEKTISLLSLSQGLRRVETKKISDWICYSQSQYRFELTESEKTENTLDDFMIARKPDLLALSNSLDQTAFMTKALFERQNILHCYKERNFLRLVIAFFDFGFEERRQRKKFSHFPRKQFQLNSKAVWSNKFEQNLSSSETKTSSPMNSAMRGLRLGHFFWPFQKVAQLFRQKFSTFTRKQGSTRTFIIFQLGLIPYAFLFGIFYTFTGFQISSSLISQKASSFQSLEANTALAIRTNEERLIELKGIEKLRRPLRSLFFKGATDSILDQSMAEPFMQSSSKLLEPVYSYSIEINAFPFELLRLSYFASKIFIVWGFLTIWKGVRPAKAARNDLVIQTRILRPTKNKKRFSDVEGIEKFLPVLKTLVESFSSEGLPEPLRRWQAFRSTFFLLGFKIFKTPSQYKGSAKKNYLIPKGYLFIGPPGTGKTLLAQAVAGEAEVNLICLSASEIQKQIDIGTRIGAIRLRNLFAQAKKNIPCILFLDEIDAIGRARNEIMDLKLFTEFLIQMDSFSVKDGFVVIGTTNFLSSLDAAFVRSGRFDRIIGLNYPGKQTRIAILKFYTQKGKNTFDKSISWNYFGELTKGLTGADLAKIVNESSLFLADKVIAHKVISENESNSTKKSSFGPKSLVHTSESLKRGIERISHLPNLFQV